MRAMINAPSRRGSASSYQQECQFAIEPSMLGLLQKAETAGWSRQQVACAMIVLAACFLNGQSSSPFAAC
jgi:hypothetical protein